MEVIIEKIRLDNNQIIHAKPINRSYDMIYRSAMGVHWDEKERCLFHTDPKEWSVLRWYKQIVLAVKNEYGDTLDVCPSTIFEDIDFDTKESIKSRDFT